MKKILILSTALYLLTTLPASAQIIFQPTMMAPPPVVYAPQPAYIVAPAPVYYTRYPVYVERHHRYDWRYWNEHERHERHDHR